MNNGTQIAGSRNDKASRIIVYVILIIWALLCIFPVYWMLTFSLKTNAEIFGENVVGLPREWVWENYSRAFHTGNMPRYFLNSLIVAVSSKDDVEVAGEDTRLYPGDTVVIASDRDKVAEVRATIREL